MEHSSANFPVSFVRVGIVLWGISLVGGTILGTLMLQSIQIGLELFRIEFATSSLAFFGVSVIVSVFSALFALKTGVKVLSRKTSPADPEVRHVAISLVIIGVINFLLIFLFFGILKTEMGLLRFAMGGGAALLIGAVLYVFGIVWLDEISVPRLEQKRPIATKKDTILFLGFLLLIGAAFFVVANKDYFRQQELARDTARTEDMKELGESLHKFYSVNSRFPDSLSELTEAGFNVRVSDPFSNTPYLYSVCKEQGYFHLGATFEAAGSFGLSWDADVEPCSISDFSGKDPVFDFIGRSLADDTNTTR